jgi:aminoglycoside phosphotransferase family enzyme/predicted kinase
VPALDDLIRELSDPSVYPHRPDSVQVIQTHISAVFIAGDLVYKIKKPLNFGFLDFTTLEKRKHFCQQEVVLNSRFSEGLYLGVVSIYRGPSGVNFTGEGSEVEAAVLMRRVPEDRLLIRMLHDDEVTPELLDRLADRLAYFHSKAETGPQISGFGSPIVIFHNLQENFDQTTPYIGKTIDLETHTETARLAMKFLKDHDDLFRERISRGFIRDCHGDLHLDHVVVLNEIMLYDCIEFNDRFRYGDTAADLAFLLMDLDFRGYPAFAQRIAERYASASGDSDVLRLLRFYESYRAFVRGKVSSFTLDESEIPTAEKEAAAMEARSYFRLSRTYLEPPRSPALVITAGLSGTGKSFISRKLGQRLGTEPISSDAVRKQIHGVPQGEHRLDKFGRGIYTSGATERTYRSLLDTAHRELIQGKPVILDATFSKFEHREAAHSLARSLNARFRILHCMAPDHVVKQRLERRSLKTNGLSDAGLEVYEAQKRVFDPIRESEREYCRSRYPEDDVAAFLESFVRELMFA